MMKSCIILSSDKGYTCILSRKIHYRHIQILDWNALFRLSFTAIVLRISQLTFRPEPSIQFGAITPLPPQ